VLQVPGVLRVPGCSRVAASPRTLGTLGMLGTPGTFQGHPCADLSVTDTIRQHATQRNEVGGLLAEALPSRVTQFR
jgi:hypothetical protein